MGPKHSETSSTFKGEESNGRGGGAEVAPVVLAFLPSEMLLEAEEEEEMEAASGAAAEALAGVAEVDAEAEEEKGLLEVAEAAAEAKEEKEFMLFDEMKLMLVVVGLAL